MLKKIVIPALFLLITPYTYGASSASVEVHNNLSSNSSSNSQTTTHTNITVETDGEITHYESNEPGNIDVKSIDGETSIKVNGLEVTPNVSGKPEASASPTTANKDESKDVNENKSIESELKDKIIEEIKKPLIILKKIFSFLNF